MRALLVSALFTAAAAAAAGCPAPPVVSSVPPPGPGSSPPPPPSYHATVRWTSHGVAHVVARDAGGLGFGQGYAQARAHLCTIADSIVRVRGERARYFGAGDGDANLITDLANRHQGFRARVQAGWPALSAESRAMLDGFAAGYNLYLARTPDSARPAACRDAAWLAPITGVDVAAHAMALQSLASTRFLEEAIAGAAPGGPATGALPARPRGAASNAWAVGSERTASGGGILVANPHFPWEGDLQFHEIHLTIPGDLDVYGVALVGTPGVQIGFTGRHAWSHTYSSSTHMVVYRLELDDANPLRYRHGDDTVPIVPTTHSIDVLGDDGTVAAVERTLYRSGVGPMIETATSPWDGPGGHAFTVRDVATAGNVTIDQYLAMARARSQAEFEAALARHGTPFVNTIYADAAGDALYVDGSRVPALTDQGLAGWRLLRKLAPAVEAAWRQGLVILDGSNPTNDLVSDDPAAPGAIAFSLAPRVARRDFVMNANDSYRFTNLAAPETQAAHSPLYGEDGDRPSPRTLMNLASLAADDVASGPDHRFTLDEAAAAMLSNRSFTAERLVDDVLRTACSRGRRPGRGRARRPARRPSPAAEACEVLAAWDRRFGADSRGAALWRELMAALARDGHVPWARRFDRQAPHLTPAGLDVDRATVVRALTRAATAVRARGALDAPLGSLQFAPRNQERIGVSGGDDLDGVASVVGFRDFNFTLLPRTTRTAPLSTTGLTADGYPVNYGTSFVLAAELTPDGPRARALLSYGNSSDPTSPWYRDQLELLARGELRPVAFTDADITADPDYTVEEIDSP